MFLTKAEKKALNFAMQLTDLQASYSRDSRIVRDDFEHLQKSLETVATLGVDLEKRLCDAETKIAALSSVAQTQQEFIQLLLLHTEAAVAHVPAQAAHWTIVSTVLNKMGDPLGPTPIDKKRK